MEERLISWIYGIAGSSCVILVVVLLLFIAPAMNDVDTVPVFLKSLILLLVYTFSLWLLHFAKSKTYDVKLKMWFGSISMHLGIMVYVILIIENIEFSLYIMIPEIIILILMLVGIFWVWSKLRGDNIIE